MMKAESRWPWLTAGACAVLLLIWLARSSRHEPAPAANGPAKVVPERNNGAGPALERARRTAHRSSSAPALTAEEIVASKVAQFGRNRRELVRAVGRRSHKE